MTFGKDQLRNQGQETQSWQNSGSSGQKAPLASQTATKYNGGISAFNKPEQQPVAREKLPESKQPFQNSSPSKSIDNTQQPAISQDKSSKREQNSREVSPSPPPVAPSDIYQKDETFRHYQPIQARPPLNQNEFNIEKVEVKKSLEPQWNKGGQNVGMRSSTGDKSSSRYEVNQMQDSRGYQPVAPQPVQTIQPSHAQQYQMVEKLVIKPQSTPQSPLSASTLSKQQTTNRDSSPDALPSQPKARPPIPVDTTPTNLASYKLTKDPKDVVPNPSKFKKGRSIQYLPQVSQPTK